MECQGAMGVARTKPKNYHRRKAGALPAPPIRPLPLAGTGNLQPRRSAPSKHSYPQTGDCWPVVSGGIVSRLELQRGKITADSGNLKGRAEIRAGYRASRMCFH